MIGVALAVPALPKVEIGFRAAAHFGAIGPAGAVLRKGDRLADAQCDG